MLIVSSIRLMLDLSVFRVPRPCFYMLGSSSQPKCIVCVNLAYTHCIRTLGSITPDHHVVLRNNEPSQRCTVRGNTFLEIIMRDHLFTTVVLSKQDAKHDKHHTQSNNKRDMIWPISFCSFDLHLRGTMIIFVTGMTPWSPSSWSPSSCLHEVVTPTITSTSMANAFSNKVK